MSDCSCCDCLPTKELSVEEWHDEYLKLAVCTVKALYEYEELIRQNTKLRELIKDLYEDMWASGEWLEPYEQRMCELGVEVDGC